jgi:hypothetical protein
MLEFRVLRRKRDETSREMRYWYTCLLVQVCDIGVVETQLVGVWVDLEAKKSILANSTVALRFRRK